MGYFYPPIIAAAPGQQTAINASYETVGLGANGAGVSVTSGAINGAGAWTLIGTVGASDINSIDIQVSPPSGSTRVSVELARDSSGTSLILGSGGIMIIAATGTIGVATIPVGVAAGTPIYARTRCTTSGVVAFISLRLRQKGALDFAGYSAGEALGYDTANARCGGFGIPLGSPGAWVAVAGTTSSTAAANTARDYGAIGFYIAGIGASFATAQSLQAALATGAAGSEVEIDRLFVRALAGAVALSNIYRLTQRAIPAGTRLSMRGDAPTPGTDTFTAGLVGFF